MKTSALRLLSLLFVAIFGLGCTAGSDPDEDADATESAQTRALPITGDWALVRWTGQVTLQQGSLWEHQSVDEHFDARARSGLATFTLGPNGDGSVLAKSRCRPTLPEARGGPARPAPTGAALVSGTYALLSAIANLIETATCDPTRLVEREVKVWPKRDLLGRPSPRLWANVGVYGERRGVNAANDECRAMRGARWIVFDDGAAACIGYADGAAQTLKLMVQRPGEIYVQRILMRRPSEP